MLVAYTVALDLIRSLRTVVEQLKGYNADSADQVVRAATSITHNIGEGSRRSGKDRKRFYRMAQGSAGEILAALDTADAWGWKVETQEARALLDREAGAPVGAVSLADAIRHLDIGGHRV